MLHEPRTETANKQVLMDTGSHALAEPLAVLCSSWHPLRNYPCVFFRRISQLSACVPPRSAQTVGMFLPALDSEIFLWRWLFIVSIDKVKMWNTFLSVEPLAIFKSQWCANIYSVSAAGRALRRRLKLLKTKEMNCVCAHDFWEDCRLSLTLVYFKAGRPWDGLRVPVKHTCSTVTEGIVCLLRWPEQECSPNVRHKVALCRILHCCTLKFWSVKVLLKVLMKVRRGHHSPRELSNRQLGSRWGACFKYAVLEIGPL